MINNPTRDIHTDYVPNDVFKPAAANALAASVEYDYVITKERIDAYRTKHSYTQADWMDVGALLWEGYEGSSPAYPTGRSAIHILINCHTTIEDRFDVGSWLSTTSSHGVTEVHIHSLSSFRGNGNAQQTVFYHTTGSENYVLFSDTDAAESYVYRSQPMYVGSFACEGDVGWHSEAIPFVYECCIAGELPHGDGGEVVDVRQEPWLSNALGGGGSGSGGGHATVVMLAPDYIGAGDRDLSGIYFATSNGYAISLPNGSPIAFNFVAGDYPFTQANTIAIEGKHLADASFCESEPGLDVSGLARVEIYTAAGIETLPYGVWTGTDGTVHWDKIGYCFGKVQPRFYINGDTLQEGQQLDIAINIVQLPPRYLLAKGEPYADIYQEWQQGQSYPKHSIVRYYNAGHYRLAMAMEDNPSGNPQHSGYTGWEEITIKLEGPHPQAIPGKSRMWKTPTCYDLYVVDSSGTQLPLYSWGYADVTSNITIINSKSTYYEPLRPAFRHTKSSLAGHSPAGFGTLADAYVTLCRVGSKILVLGSAYSGYYFDWT